jgi:putative DNA primase/helicase
MHAFTAPAAGTGKSYLADLGAAMALGQSCPIMTMGGDEEEMEKRLVQHLSQGKPLLSIDNVKKEKVVQGEAICNVLERPLWEPRILRTSSGTRLSNRWTITANGNNLKVAEDVTRRVLFSEMNAKMERPVERVFDNDPLEMILRDRGRYIAAALTIVRAYIEAGLPVRDLKPVGKSFGKWSELVRSSLVWLDCDDAVNAMAKAYDADPVRQTQARVFHVIKAVLGLETKFYARDLIERSAGTMQTIMTERPLEAEARANLKDALSEVGTNARGQLNAFSLGRWLMNNKDIRAGGLALAWERDKHEQLWRFWVMQC